MDYKPGDNLWLAIHEQYHIDVECPDCMGEGVLLNKIGESKPCGNCRGYKTVGHTRQNWHPKEVTVHSVLQYNARDGIHVARVFFDEEDTYPEFEPSQHETYSYVDNRELNYLFDDALDCQVYCDMMNEKYPRQNFG